MARCLILAWPDTSREGGEVGVGGDRPIFRHSHGATASATCAGCCESVQFCQGDCHPKKTRELSAARPAPLLTPPRSLARAPSAAPTRTLSLADRRAAPTPPTQSDQGKLTPGDGPETPGQSPGATFFTTPAAPPTDLWVLYDRLWREKALRPVIQQRLPQGTLYVAPSPSTFRGLSSFFYRSCARPAQPSSSSSGRATGCCWVWATSRR